MCFKRGGAWREQGDGDRLVDEEYVFDGEVATELGGGGREVLAALLLAATRVRGEEEGVYVQLYYCELRGWIGANNDGGEELQKRTRIQSFKE